MIPKRGHGVGIETFAHGQNTSPTGGSHNTTTTEKLVDAVVGKKTYVYALTLSTTDITADNIVQITNGSGGTVLYEIQFGSGVQGVTLPGSLIAYFSTTAATELHIKLSAAQKVSYSFSQYPE